MSGSAHSAEPATPTLARRPLRLRSLPLPTLRLWLQRPADRARASALLRAAGADAFLVDDPGDPSAALAAAAEARRAGVAVAVALDAATAAAAIGDAVDGEGPLTALSLCVVRPPKAGALRAHLAALREALSRLRTVRPRLASLGWPLCSSGAGEPVGLSGLILDLAIEVSPATPAVPHVLSDCRTCPVADRCPGWPRQRLDDGPRPPTSSISNQADFVEDAALDLDLSAALAADAGPELKALALPLAVAALEGEAPPPVAAALLVEPLAEGRALVRRFVCTDAAFAVGGAATAAGIEAELARDGQLWLDASDKARLDDFANDIKMLQQSAPAVELSDGLRLPARWRLRDGADAFAAEEAWLRAEIAGLGGVVVDVGAGPLRYLDLLRPATDAATLTYVAIEPEASALAALRTALPRAVLARGVGEALPLPAASADHVLVLRAWNHLRDPLRALAEAHRVLRPGGRLLLVDNVAFGLLRSAEAAAKAHAISVEATPFEHARNDGAAEAQRWLDRSGLFVVTAARAVGRQTSNQWSILARRLDRPGG